MRRARGGGNARSWSTDVGRQEEADLVPSFMRAGDSRNGKMDAGRRCLGTRQQGDGRVMAAGARVVARRARSGGLVSLGQRAMARDGSVRARHRTRW